jgi:hypothetical protein
VIGMRHSTITQEDKAESEREKVIGKKAIVEIMSDNKEGEIHPQAKPEIQILSAYKNIGPRYCKEKINCMHHKHKHKAIIIAYIHSTSISFPSSNSKKHKWVHLDGGIPAFLRF